LRPDRRNHGPCSPSPAADIANAKHVYYGDVHVGTIARRTGCPVDVDQWEWKCGFYPGMEPGQHQGGTAIDFDRARADIEGAWRTILPTLTDADFQAWRHQRDWTEQKYAMWERGEKLPSQWPNTMICCPCGRTFDGRRLEHTLIHVPHSTAAQRSNEVSRRPTLR
jgi:hypothetical protein